MTALAALGIDDYRKLLDEVFDQRIVDLAAEAEAAERFPRELVERLGKAGVFAHKWRNGQQPDMAKLVAQVDVQAPYRKVGAGPLDTAAVHIDTHVPADALIARPGNWFGGDLLGAGT